MHARVADSALGVVQQYVDLPATQVELAQPRPVRGVDELLFVGIFAKSRIALVGRAQVADGEDDLLGAVHRPEGLLNEGRVVSLSGPRGTRQYRHD